MFGTFKRSILTHTHKDIVDTEPYWDDIYQVALGSIDEEQDQANDQAKPPTPPDPPESHSYPSRAESIQSFSLSLDRTEPAITQSTAT